MIVKQHARLSMVFEQDCDSEWSIHCQESVSWSGCEGSDLHRGVFKCAEIEKEQVQLVCIISVQRRMRNRFQW